MKIHKAFIASFLAVACLTVSCTDSDSTNQSATNQAAETSPQTLKEAFEDDFYVGAALNYRQANGNAPQATEIIKEQFNTVSPENLLKWESVHPKPGIFNFEPADKYVALGQQNNMFVVGHTLVWHNQTPTWVFEDEQGNAVSKEVLLQRMQEHIDTVAGRYRGKINGWDVVNEALNDDGTLRQSKWLNIIGEEFLEKAFQFAHEAAPDAELYYNDYNMWKPEKRDGAIRIVRNLQNKGIKVDGIGMQGHWGLENPSIEQIEASIEAIAQAGVKVMITELDIDVLPNPSNRQGADIDATFEFDERYNLYTTGLPDSVQQKLTQRYTDIFDLFRKHSDKISRITFWGVTDNDSWLNDWPIKGRTSYPMLFDRNYQPKPAFNAVINTAAKKQQ
ncbi:endo-1,4-beta-xylanase [Pontibacter silvestris]|uniref:Beta-xylanase n=1 Tax=Pontibacter silvestris TaxID=2305183 RepID=A0ABW4WX58_9BACT|nr:endo-1,4-beta-xylanase [Pontibacter silvestris]MCC9136687.1 endo-1,4-beta-xylanase [Pontibacter silvestris]